VDNFCREFPNVRLCLQLSVDGPEKVHEEIRGMPGLFKRLRETNRILRRLAEVHNNLTVQLITVFSSFNREYLEEFYEQSAKTFFFHRVILTPDVTAGFSGFNGFGKKGLYNELLKKVHHIHREMDKDIFNNFSIKFHEAKDEVISRWETKRNLGKYCQAGKSIIVLRERGDVFPCEPLGISLGNIRDYEYDIRKLLRSKSAREFFKNYPSLSRTCHCSWSCAQTNALVSNPRYWFRIAKALLPGRSRI